jgi:hypothetical protein
MEINIPYINVNIIIYMYQYYFQFNLIQFNRNKERTYCGLKF